MRAKLDQLRDAWASGDPIGALRIASRFSERSDETIAFKRAWDAHSNPGFYRQIGRDPAVVKQAGIDAMARRFKLTPKTQAHFQHRTIGLFAETERDAD